MPKDSLEISLSETDKTRVTIAGEVDFHNAGAIREVLGDLFRNELYDLTIDVADLEFIDSSGLSALLDAAKVARSHAGEVRLVSPGSQLIHVLTIAGFAPYFSIAPRGERARKPAPSAPPASQTAWQVSQFEVPARTELIADVRNRVADFAECLPFSEQDIEDIKLAVGEGASNALRYGCPESRDSITVRCSQDGATLRVQIKDKGPCFDPDCIDPPGLDALDEGGRGIYFMRILMDEVRYFFSSSGTMVELVKQAGRPPQPDVQ